MSFSPSKMSTGVIPHLCPVMRRSATVFTCPSEPASAQVSSGGAPPSAAEGDERGGWGRDAGGRVGESAGGA